MLVFLSIKLDNEFRGIAEKYPLDDESMEASTNIANHCDADFGSGCVSIRIGCFHRNNVQYGHRDQCTGLLVNSSMCSCVDE